MQWHLTSFESLTSNQLYQILALRINVFMLEQRCLYPECDGKDHQAQHLFLKDNGICLCYARLIPPGISYADCSIGRVVVHQDYRGRGLARQLMSRAMSFLVEKHPGISIRISAQKHLVGFYKTLGFDRESGVYLEDGIPHIEMAWYPQQVQP